jgi:hypothetical protein
MAEDGRLSPTIADGSERVPRFAFCFTGRVQLDVAGALGGSNPFGVIGLVLAYPAYVLIMAFVLRLCGVSRAEIAKWALKQADRQRLADLIRAVWNARVAARPARHVGRPQAHERPGRAGVVAERGVSL